MPAPDRSRLTLLLGLLAVAVPAGTVALALRPDRRTVPLLTSPVAHFPPATLPFDRVTVGPEPGFRPQITHVQVADLDADGRADVLVSDAQRGRVLWYRRLPDGGFEERPVGDELNCPGPFCVTDLDRDGDPDVVASVVGSVYPTDDRVGRVVWLENVGGRFTNRVLLDDVRRVTDVHAADLDADGDLDLSVAVYGFDHGEVLWLENRGGTKFRDHRLFASQGPSHVPVADFDGDGRPDIAALVSQDHEEVWLFRNLGGGRFAPQKVHAFTNFDLGSAGLVPCDLNRDGRPDLLLSAGDNLEINHHHPQPWHGPYWLENLGDGRFRVQHLAAVGGVYAAAAADFDGDGHTDVAVASMFNDWRDPGAASLVLLTNDGRGNFSPSMLADRPTSLATLAAGDLDGDGRPDLVAGSLHLHHPADRAGRVTAWLNRGGGR